MPSEAPRIPLAALIGGGSRAGRERKRVCTCIMEGGIVLYPTETIYGIGGNAFDPAVGARLSRIKKRSSRKTMILIAGSEEVFSPLGLEFPSRARRLADRLWPGKVTLVLPKGRGSSSIAVRVSPHPFIRAIYPPLRVPIYSTSANMSDRPYSGDPGEIYRIFSRRIDLMIDAGRLAPSLPSTVVKLDRSGGWEIVRQGVVPRELISGILDGESGLY